jgi:hypothetical protein
MFSSKSGIVVLFVAVLALSMLSACGNDVTTAASAPDVAPTIAPTPTFEVVEVTAVPIPTETPAPVATVESTIEPTIELTDDVAAQIIAETESQPIAEFPEKLNPSSAALPDEEVLVLWQEFLNGTRRKAIANSIIFEFCSDGTGTWVYEVGTPAFTGANFDYTLHSDPGASWHSIVVNVKMREKRLYDILNYAGGDGFRIALTPPKEGQIAYDSPDCN